MYACMNALMYVGMYLIKQNKAVWIRAFFNLYIHMSVCVCNFVRAIVCVFICGCINSPSP
jgi:hypothetical protein